MKRILGLATATAVIGAMAIALSLASTAAAEPPTLSGLDVTIDNYPSTIKPGGTYDVTATVTKPDNLDLSGSEWAELRAYYYKPGYTYEGTGTAVCFSKGKVTSFGGSQNYDGWWNDRIWKGFIWNKGSTTKTRTIPTQVVNKPRDDEEMKFTFEEIPVGGEVTLRVRLRIRSEGIDKISLDDQGNGTITFMGGSEYSVNTHKKYGYVNSLPNATLEKSYGEWKLDVNADRTVSVESGGAGGALALPLAAKVGIGIVIAVIVIGIAVVKMRGGEEVPA